MQKRAAVGLWLVCAVACLAREYELVESLGDAEGGGADGGGTSGLGGSSGAGGKGGSVSTGGDAGDDPGSGGSFSGASGQGGTTSGGASGSSGDTSGGSSGNSGSSNGGDGGLAGRAAGGRGGASAGAGGTGGTGGTGKGGSSGTGGAGAGGTSGKGGTGGVAGGGTGGKGGSAGSGGACGCVIHRYSFSSTGAVAQDSVGTAHGTITGGTQAGGVVSLLGGASDQYVTLPSGILSGLTSVTLEFWVSWAGGTSNWQRVFDFGENDGTNGGQGSTNATSSYFAFSTRAMPTSSSPNCTTTTNGLPRVTFTLAGPAQEVCVFGSSAFPTGTTHAAVTINGMVMSLYIAGAPSGSPAILSASLSSIDDTNNWLGRSQFAADTEFAGTISEFRIYNVARTAAQIAASYSAGPDSVPTQ